MRTATHRRSQPAPGWKAGSVHVPGEEFAVLQSWHPNVLLGGSSVAIAAAIQELDTVFRPVIVSSTAGSALPVPPETGTHTLILHDVELLSPDDQQQLLAWLQKDRGRVQVIATTTRPLLPLVESGQFNASLYYALNVVFIKLAA
jgi:hypothetical protein